MTRSSKVSTEYSTPGTYRSISTDDCDGRPSPVVSPSRTAAAAARTSSRVAHRRTATEPEPAAGLHTTGRPSRLAASTAASVVDAAAKSGPGTPAAASVARFAALSRQARTASGSPCGRPSARAAPPAVATKYSELLVTPATRPSREAMAASTAVVEPVSTRRLSTRSSMR